MWWDHLLKALGLRVKDGEIVPTHFPEPDPPFVVDRQPHDLAIRLWEGVLTKHTCGRGGRRRRPSSCYRRRTGLRRIRLFRMSGTATGECNDSDRTQQQHAQQQQGITASAGRPATRSLLPGGTCKRCPMEHLNVVVLFSK